MNKNMYALTKYLTTKLLGEGLENILKTRVGCPFLKILILKCTKLVMYQKLGVDVVISSLVSYFCSDDMFRYAAAYDPRAVQSFQFASAFGSRDMYPPPPPPPSASFVRERILNPYGMMGDPRVSACKKHSTFLFSYFLVVFRFFAGVPNRFHVRCLECTFIRQVTMAIIEDVRLVLN